MKAPGSSIDSRMYSSADLPFSIFAAWVFSWSRFGPIVPLDFAGPNVWQPGAAGRREDLRAGLRLGRGPPRRARPRPGPCEPGRSPRRRPRRSRPRPAPGRPASGCRSAGAGSACARSPRPCRGRSRPGARPGRRCRGSGPTLPAVPARASVWQEPHFSTNFALPVSRLGSLRPQAPRPGRSRPRRAPRGLTVLRVRLTGREHYSRAAGRRCCALGPDAAAITPSATLSQEYRRAASEASAARASSRSRGVQLEPGHELRADLPDGLRAHVEGHQRPQVLGQRGRAASP